MSEYTPEMERASRIAKPAVVAFLGHVLRSLVYFDDAEEERMPRMFDDVEWADVRAAIEGWVKEVVEGSE